MSTRKLILFISMSLDGYVASKEDDLSFLQLVETPGEDYGYSAFTQTIDTYLVGRKTYEVVKTLLDGDFPQARSYRCYVLTRQPRPAEDGVEFYTGELKTLINDLKKQDGKHLYCDGGPEIVKALLDEGLIDELRISVIPVLLGDGKRLFLEGFPQQALSLKGVQQYPSGLVQLHYERK